MSQEQLYFQNQEESYQKLNQSINHHFNQQNQQFLQSNQSKSKNKKIKIQGIHSQSKDQEIFKNNVKNQNQNINSNDIANNNQSAAKRKNRRKKVDDDGRDYTCSCGKSYLSYPALYTHVKTKHNGQLSMLTDPQSKNKNSSNQPKIQQSSLIQNTLNSLNYNNHYNGDLINHNKASQPYPNDSQYHQSKKQKVPNSLVKPLISNQQIDQQIVNIQKLKQFIYKQFIKDKSNESLSQMKNSLKLNDQQIRYIKNIIHQAEEINDKDSFVNRINFGLQGSNKINSKPQKDPVKNQQQRDKVDCLKLKKNQDQNNVAGNNGLVEFNSPIRRSVLANKNALSSIPLHISSSNSNLHNSNNNSSPSKFQKKGFSSYVRLAHQNALQKKQNRQEQNFYIEQIFGIFLSQVFRTSCNAYYHHELVNLMCINFICRIREYFNKKLINPAEKQTQLLIQQANDMIQYFVQINENKYLKQPVAICKIMFFFYRWLYMAKFTNKYVKFNEVGGTNRYSY